MFQKSYAKYPKHPYVITTGPFCSQFVFEGAHPDEIGHENSVWCDNCEKMYKEARSDKSINENTVKPE
ncbi:MAG: hypothetical protein K9L17_05010 [Clostridiales bacterium]|nr:hypothetical protein [Clostridiales bacterium]MCF8022029.1 hypothetical protein [Clostridiales bacterium]